MDRRSLLGGLASAAVPVQALTLERKKGILFRFDTGEIAGFKRQTGAFLLAEVAGYSRYLLWCAGQEEPAWYIFLKGAGQSHVLDQSTFERFERDYLAWIDGL